MLFIQNFNTTLAASENLETVAKIQYLCTLVHGKALRQFDSLSADVEVANTLNVETIILGLALYFSTVNLLSKKKRAMRCRMKKTRGLRVK